MSDLAATRRSLHAVAEQVMAGPMYRASGTIRLRITVDGFGTVAEPYVQLNATHLIGLPGIFPLHGATCAGLAAGMGVEVGPPGDLYKDLTGVDPDEPLSVDPKTAADLLAALRRGEAALARLAPKEFPVLWPEHFDVGIAVDEVNYGISPGDDHCPEPYAYVAPWTPRTGEFWNAPFGAARPLSELTDARLDAFLTEGQKLARQERPAHSR